MKKQLTMLAATVVLGITSGFAANPFSDVTPDDWAYQAVHNWPKKVLLMDIQKDILKANITSLVMKWHKC